jgi:release factor glutamine methyltransferase
MPADPSQRIDATLTAAAARLEAAGVASACLDAELLLRHVLQWDRAALLTRSTETLDADARGRFLGLVAERAKRRPLQHLVGTQAFWRHEFRVTSDVLIPRPETEVLVEAALERLAAIPRPVIVDVGTGSGCIALSLAAELPEATIRATDISARALDVARENARRLGLEGRVTFHEGDLLSPVASLGPFDLVASNPPYVDASEIEALAPEVRDHEPRLALVPPGDAYAVYRRLAPAARATLRPGGLLLLEIGKGMADGVSALCVGSGLLVEAVIPDLQGISRTLVARA